MELRNLNIVLVLLLALSCNSKPRVIESEPPAEQAGAGTFPDLQAAPLVSDAIPEEHKVVVEEVLNTDKYTYLSVSENGEKYWIAIQRADAKVGDIFYYRGGLLKKNFFSPEFKRVFETVYLVSEFWKEPDGGGPAFDEASAQAQGGGEIPDLAVGKIERAKGAIKLSELYANKEKYNNQVIKVTGKCVKVNPMIMNRNWIHIRDGSGEDFDLTITTMENVPLGAVVTLEGTVALDKDFGAGYRYDVILEGAVVQ